MAEMNEAETIHLSEDYPEMSKKIRVVRKKVEEEAFGFAKRGIGPSDLSPIVDELLQLEKKEHGGEKEDDFVPDEAFERVLPGTPGNVLKAIDHYKGEYGAAASFSDIQFILTIPHRSKLDKQIDKAFAKVPMPEIERSVRELQREGLVAEAPDGGYLPTEAGRERLGLTDNAEGLNLPKAHNQLKMLKGSDVGLIVGSQLAAKGTEILADWADTQYNLDTLPLHQQISTYVPVIGAVVLLASNYVKAIKKKPETQLAAAVFGAHLLAKGVDVAQQAAQPGVTFGLIQVPRAVYQPGLTAAPTPGYLPMTNGVVGGLRNIF